MRKSARRLRDLISRAQFTFSSVPALLIKTGETQQVQHQYIEETTNQEERTLDVPSSFKEPPHVTFLQNIRNNLDDLNSLAARIGLDSLLDRVELLATSRVITILGAPACAKVRAALLPIPRPEPVMRTAPLRLFAEPARHAVGEIAG